MTGVYLKNSYHAVLGAAEKAGSSRRGIQIYALDPGETTGRCRHGLVNDFDQTLGQLATKTVEEGYDAIRLDLLSGSARPDVIVCEDYKVYGWKADDHKWASLHTAQLIGAIKVLAHQLQIPIRFQMAGEAKPFVTDEKLKEWGVYVPGQKHARDAQRHAIFYQLFGRKKK